MLQNVPSAALPCPACGETAAPRLLYQKNGCDILRCESCGLGRAEAAADFDPQAYYNEGYFSGAHADGYADYRGAEPVLRREFAGAVDFLRGFVPAGGRLVELGCAYGFFLDEAKRVYNACGIELAADAAESCRARGLDVMAGVADAETLDRLKPPFDAVVLLDVIEHLPQPVETIALAAQRLKPGGVIMLTTGDFASLAARVTGARWRLMTPPQHLWFFTPASMRGLARQLGLAVESLDHPWKTVPLSLILFQIRRMLGLPVEASGEGGAGAQSGGVAGQTGVGASRIGIPVNLFDAMRVVLRKA